MTPPVSRHDSKRSISPTANQERGWKYANRQNLLWDEERPRSSTPRKLRHKSLTGNHIYIELQAWIYAYTCIMDMCVRGGIAVLQHARSMRSMNKSNCFCCSGALDISEEVVVAVGLPHVSEIWEEIHRVHHHKKSPLVHSSEYRTLCHTECIETLPGKK